MTDRFLMKEMIKSRVEKYLSRKFYCGLQELQGKGTVYTLNHEAERPYMKLMAYRNCVLVCTSKDIQAKVQELLQGKSRDEMFECPLVYGQTIHYVPDGDPDRERPAPSGFRFVSMFEEEILSLKGLQGFENSLAFDENGRTSTRAVYAAMDKEKIIGVAGAAESSLEGMWEVGVDVLEEYRMAGLGTYVVECLTRELLEREIVPFYSASVTNLSSQLVACRSGYIPCWVDTFGTILQ